MFVEKFIEEDSAQIVVYRLSIYYMEFPNEGQQNLEYFVKSPMLIG